MLREVHLHGYLKETYGGPFVFDVADSIEAVRALKANFPTFDRDLVGGRFQIVRGAPDSGLELGEEDLTLQLGNARELHFVPVTAGAGGRGTGKIVLGVALIGLAFAAPHIGLGMAGTTGSLAQGTAATAGYGVGGALGSIGLSWGSIAGFGLMMTLSGVAAMLAPTPEFRGPRDGNESFLFSGPQNTTEQGVPVPVIYGAPRVGSVVVSAALEAEEVDRDSEVDDSWLDSYFSWPNISVQGVSGTTFNNRIGVLPGDWQAAITGEDFQSFTLRLTLNASGTPPQRVVWVVRGHDGTEEDLGTAWQNGSYVQRNLGSNTLHQIGIRVEGPPGQAISGSITLRRVDGEHDGNVDSFGYSLGGMWQW